MSSEFPPAIYTLPLFPLSFVLFPEFTVQLHVFEERYKAMISTCLERNTPFGIVLIREGEEVGPTAIPHDVGCTARILAVKQEDDGRMHLLAIGGERFRLLEAIETDEAYLLGRVEALEDLPDTAEKVVPPAQEMSNLFRRYLHLLEETAHFELPDLDLPTDPTLLAFTIAAISQLAPLDKQRLLAMTDTISRLEEGNRYLRRQIAELEALRTGQSLVTSDETSDPPILLAEPLDATDSKWQRYRQNSRN